MNATNPTVTIVAMVRLVYVDVRCPICKEYIANSDNGSFNYEINDLPATVHCRHCNIDMPVSKKVHGTFRTSK